MYVQVNPLVNLSGKVLLQSALYDSLFHPMDDLCVVRAHIIDLNCLLQIMLYLGSGVAVLDRYSSD